jgi:23S rRNA (cytosine1962-C5)-methyltransferase
MKNLDLITSPWPDYELLDYGDNRKLERYGKFIIARPETQAIWKQARPELWKQAAAEFEWAEGKGKWRFNKGGDKTIPESWQLSWRDVQFTVRLTSFKHTGVFPEQAANWEWIEKMVQLQQPGMKVLNLFGYTGIASIVAAKVGAQVTHVDASKRSNDWAKENARISGIVDGARGTGSIKFLLDDALKFVEREVRRGASYDGIILDPPAFGRGAKGEVWHIEDHLPRLLDALTKLLRGGAAGGAKKPGVPDAAGAFFLLNGYAAGYSPQSFLQAIESAFNADNVGEFGELSLTESGGGRIVPQGIYARFAF